MLWLIFIVHLSFAMLPRKVASLFSSLVLLLFIFKRSMLASGYLFPFWIPEELVHEPRLVDICTPAFFNIFLAFVSNHFHELARKQISSTKHTLINLDRNIREAEERYQFIVENGMAFITIHTLEGEILFVNKPALAVLGYTEEELRKLKIPDMLDDHVRSEYSEYVDSIIKNGTTEGLLKVKNKAGDSMVWHFRNVCIDQPEVGIRIFGFAQDVTELDRKRKLLKQNEGMLEALVSSLDDIMLLLDRDEKLLKCWARIPSFPDLQSSYGKNILEILPILFHQPEEVAHVFRQARREAILVETKVRTVIDSKSYWLRVRIAPITGDSHLSASIQISDVTLQEEREIHHQQSLDAYTTVLRQSFADIQEMTVLLSLAKEKAEESDRLKSLFLANISHEIRTPMNAIMGFSELLERPNLDPQKRVEFTQLIRERSTDLLRLIENVLEMARIEAGRTTLFETDGNVDEMMEHLLAAIKKENRHLQKKNLEFKKVNQLPENQLRFDFARVHLILNNLLTNAVKFTEAGFITLECKMERPGVLLFTVRDTGMGISKGDQHQLFRPFRQANERIHKHFGGSGLGLSICKGLVNLMGGEIWFESEEGTGSSFHFTVPLKEP
jgi:PAS domain S-box-containing protein